MATSPSPPTSSDWIIEDRIPEQGLSDLYHRLALLAEVANYHFFATQHCQQEIIDYYAHPPCVL